jgi:hypothetical protein
MTKEEKNELIPLFGLLYYAVSNSKEIDESTTQEFITKIESDKSLQKEIATAAADESDKYSELWTKAKELHSGNKAGESVMSAAKGAKLNKLKKLQSMKKGAKKCKCGCEIISVKEKGGKMTDQCACNCGGGKVKMKAKGGILEETEIYALTKVGVIDPSVSNKWERKLNSRKLGKFKK